MERNKVSWVLVPIGILIVGVVILATQFTGTIRTAVVYPEPNIAVVVIDFPNKVDEIHTQQFFVNNESQDAYEYPGQHKPLSEYPKESIQISDFSFAFLPVRTEIYEVATDAGEKKKCKITIYGNGNSTTQYITE